MTTRGMKEEEAKKIVELISKTLEGKDSIENIRKEVHELTAKFPVYRS